MENKSELQHIAADFKRLSAAAPMELVSFRQRHFANFLAQGWPTSRNEDWKYTNLTKFKKIPFQVGTLPSSHIEQRYKTEDAVVFVDGYIQHVGQRLTETPGLLLRSPLLFTDLEGMEGAESDAFAHLNSALFGEGVALIAEENTKVSQPIKLIFLTTAEVDERAVYPRLLVRLRKNSQLILSEQHFALGDKVYFSDSVAHFSVAEGASLQYTKLQNENRQGYHFSSQIFNVDRDATLDCIQVSVGAQLTRQNTNVYIYGERSAVNLKGLYLVDDTRHVDNHTLIHHKAPNSSSRQLYKGILSNESRAVFNGKIRIDSVAQKTDSSQYNKNILLSERAEVDTKPELQIYADDVKATHGATVGQLNADEIFYFVSRGISKPQAIRMLSKGFADEILFAVEDPGLRADFIGKVNHELKGYQFEGIAP